MNMLRMQDKIPILMYHEVCPEETKANLQSKIQHSFVLTTEQFEQQMGFLAESGFSSITLNELIAAISGPQLTEIKPNSIVVTFDDGFAGNFHHALPILKRYGLCATFFVIVNKVGCQFMMGWDELKALRDAGMSVQSHAMNHILMAKLDDQETMRELFDSKQAIENRLAAPVHYISLPNGSYHRRYPSLAKAVGYLGGCTSDVGYCDANSNPYLLNRISITSRYSLQDFAKTVSGDSTFIERMRKRQRLRKSIEFIISEATFNRLYHLIYGVEEV